MDCTKLNIEFQIEMENRKSSLSVVTGHFEERYEDPIDFTGADIQKMTES